MAEMVESMEAENKEAVDKSSNGHVMVHSKFDLRDFWTCQKCSYSTFNPKSAKQHEFPGLSRWKQPKQ